MYCKDDLSDLVELCSYYLENTAEREKIAAAAAVKFMKYHTHRQRAEVVLKSFGFL